MGNSSERTKDEVTTETGGAKITEQDDEISGSSATDGKVALPPR